MVQFIRAWVFKSLRWYQRRRIYTGLEQAEVLSLVGDISMYKDEQKLHAHIVLGKADGTAHGGHLMEATVHPTLEIIITESPIYLEREIDKESGLALIKI